MAKKKEKKNGVDSVEAKKILADEQKARSERCHQKVQAALAEENCEIVVGMLVTSAGNTQHVQIVARPK